MAPGSYEEYPYFVPSSQHINTIYVNSYVLPMGGHTWSPTFCAKISFSMQILMVQKRPAQSSLQIVGLIRNLMGFSRDCQMIICIFVMRSRVRPAMTALGVLLYLIFSWVCCNFYLRSHCAFPNICDILFLWKLLHLLQTK